MEINVIDSKDNSLLSRKEVNFRVDHPKEATPKIQDVKPKLAAILTAAEELVFVDNLQSEFGKPSSVGYAKVYESVESAKKIEKEHILKMNEKKVEKNEEST